LEVLGPDAREATDPQVNNRGAVVRVGWGDVTFLLAADIEAKAEQALLDDGIDVAATVLKVAHHGSETSSSAAFLAAVHPQVSVVSAGAENPFGHPRPAVVARLAAYGPVLTTADDGTVRFSTDGRRLWIETAR